MQYMEKHLHNITSEEQKGVKSQPHHHQGACHPKGLKSNAFPSYQGPGGIPQPIEKAQSFPVHGLVSPKKGKSHHRGTEHTEKKPGRTVFARLSAIATADATFLWWVPLRPLCLCGEYPPFVGLPILPGGSRRSVHGLVSPDSANPPSPAPLHGVKCPKKGNDPNAAPKSDPRSLASDP